tara:strand:+ start:235 stop:432 length:198 start_codon:yes stop_codon:yes gene_type:complete
LDIENLKLNQEMISKDIKKVKQDDTSLLGLLPPEDYSKLIQIRIQITISERIRLLEKVKKGKKDL